MSLWGRADRFLAISDTSERRSEAETLIAQIAEGLSIAGEFVAHLDLEPTQGIVDFSWAARQAGRRLAIRVDVTSELVKADGQMRVTVKALAPLATDSQQRPPTAN